MSSVPQSYYKNNKLSHKKVKFTNKLFSVIGNDYIYQRYMFLNIKTNETALHIIASCYFGILLYNSNRPIFPYSSGL